MHGADLTAVIGFHPNLKPLQVIRGSAYGAWIGRWSAIPRVLHREWNPVPIGAGDGQRISLAGVGACLSRLLHRRLAARDPRQHDAAGQSTSPRHLTVETIKRSGLDCSYRQLIGRSQGLVPSLPARTASGCCHEAAGVREFVE